MARRKKIVILPLAKKYTDGRWYVEYSVRNPHTDLMVRFRVFEGFSNCKDDQEKCVYADKLVKEYTDKLRNGWTPFVGESVIYEDEIMYKNAVRIYGKMKSETITVNTYLSEFVSLKKLEVAKKTCESYVSKLRLFSLWLKSKSKIDLHIAKIDNDIIVDFLRGIAIKNNLSRVTMDKYQQILYTFFEFLRKKKKVISENPVTNIPRVGVLKDEAPAGIPESYRKVLKDIIEKEDPQLWLCCAIQYYAAIRPGDEMRFLKVGDINFVSKTIKIHNVYAKNNRTETIDAPDNLFKIFIAFQIHKYPSSDYVFGKEGIPSENHLGKNSLRIRFNKFREQLRLPIDIKLYSWKHSGAQELSDAGVNTYEISKHLRHKSIVTTEHYTRKRLGQRSSRIKHDFPTI